MRSKGPSGADAFDAFIDRMGSTARKPNLYRYEPMPHQELFHQSLKKGRILFGGNRGGKTYSGSADDLLIATHRHPHRQHLYRQGPLNIRFIGVDFDRGINEGAIPIYQQLLPPSFLKNGSWEDSYDRQGHKLTLADKTTISFMSYEQHANKFQIVALDHIHFDEEPPEAIFKESMLRLVDHSGSWTLSETPVQQLEWVQDQLIEPAEAGLRDDIDVFYLDTRDNTHLPSEELATLEATMTEEEKIVRLAGKYPGGNLVFPEFDRKYPSVIPAEAFTLTDEHVVYCSMDYGYANPTVFAYTAVHPDGTITTFKLLYAPNIIVSEWVKLVHKANREVGELLGLGPDNGWRPHLYVGDPSIGSRGGAGQTGITIQQAYSMGGIPIAVEGIVAARTKNQNIGLNKMHTYLRKRPATHPDRPGQPWWQITDECPQGINEMKKARKPKQTAANKEVKNTSEEIRDKDNHFIDAIKYLFILTHDLRPVEYRDEADDLTPEEAGMLNLPMPAPTTHQQAYDAMVSDKSAWEIHGGDNYASLED
jgi:phage terminase large subunit-like protein